MTVTALVLRTAGTNCDQESAHAVRLAGGQADVHHVNRLLNGDVQLDSYQLLIIPGGFSYGDDVAAGKILANEFRFKAGPMLQRFVQDGKRVIGICNGFQVLVKAGLLPGSDDVSLQQTVTLAHNDSGQFQCHWVDLEREKSACRWLEGTDADWPLPMAHGEGKFIAQDKSTLQDLEKNGQVVFRYKGRNPNGSQNAIAGICSRAGNVIGLMPHPERHVRASQHPEWTRRPRGTGEPVGLQFFRAAVRNWN